MTQQLSDEEIIKKQERLYELERDCSTGPQMTEEEKMQRIRALLADDYWEKLLVKAEARRKEHRTRNTHHFRAEEETTYTTQHKAIVYL